MRTRPPGPLHRGRTIVGRTTVALALSSVGMLATTGAADAVEPCTTPGVSQGDPGHVTGTDNTVNVFAAGDLTVEGAAEAEGVVVVGGDLTTDRFYNVGTVGGGSHVAPAAGSVMLEVGGDVKGAGTVDVGSGLGGDAVVGGSVDPAVSITLNGGTLMRGVTAAAALGDDADLLAALRAESARLASGTPTGTVTHAGSTTTLTGDGRSTQQVFDVTDAAVLGSTGSPVTVVFDRIPDDATVVVNVHGDDVATDVTDMRRAGHTDPFDQNGDDAGLASYASRTVWNILDDASPTIDGGAQWAGSVLVPTPGGTTVVSVPGLNGRAWVAGNLVHANGGGNGGNEFHSYPFTGSDALTCTPGDRTPSGDTHADGTKADDTPKKDTPADDQPRVQQSPSDEQPPAGGDEATVPGDDSTPVSDTTPGADEGGTPAGVASPSSTDTTVVLAAGGEATPSMRPEDTGRGVLARTGADLVPIVSVAAALVVAGAVLLALRRRRAA